jgi:hypothetical protein
MKLGKYDIREMNPFLIPVTTLTELTSHMPIRREYCLYWLVQEITEYLL